MKLHLAGQARFFERQQHAEGGRLVRAEDAVQLALAGVLRDQQVFAGREGALGRGAAVLVVADQLDVGELADGLQEAFFAVVRAGRALLVAQHDHVAFAARAARPASRPPGGRRRRCRWRRSWRDPCPSRSESKMTTGTPDLTAALTGATSAVSLSGASTMPATPCAVKLCTRSTCDFRSSSLSGPFQMISTFSSLAAFAAPACTAFQNSCVVPLGTTAMRSFFSRSRAPPAARRRPFCRRLPAAARQANPNCRSNPVAARGRC